MPDENPSGLGAFEFPMMLSLYYRDKETGMQYATMRDCYDTATGRFCEPDPIGAVLFEQMAFRNLAGSIGLGKFDLEAQLYSDEPRNNHLYLYVRNNPLGISDPTGLLTAPTASGFPVGPAVPGSPNASQSGSGSNMLMCGFSWKDERSACRASCVATGRAMGGLSGEAYTSRCIMMCNITYTKP